MCTETFRFGSARYDLHQIREIGFRHGRDGITYYPPQYWGRAEESPFSFNRTPAGVGHGLTPLEDVYIAGYIDGYYSRNPRGVNP